MSPGLLMVKSTSSVTSGSVRALPEIFRELGEPSVTPESDVRHTVAAREFADPQSPATWIIEFKDSTRAPSFGVYAYLTTPREAAIINSFKGHVDYVFHVSERPEFRHMAVRERTVAHGPPPESWTIPTWGLLTRSGSFEESLADLAEIADRIRNQVLPDRSPGLIALAQRAVERLAERGDEDIEAWANRLADDVSDLND